MLADAAAKKAGSTLLLLQHLRLTPTFTRELFLTCCITHVCPMPLSPIKQKKKKNQPQNTHKQQNHLLSLGDFWCSSSYREPQIKMHTGRQTSERNDEPMHTLIYHISETVSPAINYITQQEKSLLTFIFSFPAAENSATIPRSGVQIPAWLGVIKYIHF